MSEYMQPVNPIRVWQSSDNANYCHQVFAIGIVEEDYSSHVVFLTVNGLFMHKSHIMYAEVLIEGKWTAIQEHRFAQIVPA
jgi:hypothetical protein